ncbi:MAG: hypothetical protein AB7S41_03485 [Parvibaculaceae bacterium]
MKAALYVLALLLVGAGVGAGLASFLSPGQVIHGIDAGLAGTLLAGGFMVFGFAALATAIEGLNQTLGRTIKLLEARATLAAEAAAAGQDFTPRFHPAHEPEPPAAREIEEEPEDEPEAPEPAPILLGHDKPEPEPEREELTLPALSDEPDPVKEAAEAKAAAAEPEPEQPEAAEDELYVVEEREFRGRPARVLSDGTVEAETDEGWMRFENMEHLEEYMDAMSTMARGA